MQNVILLHNRLKKRAIVTKKIFNSQGKENVIKHLHFKTTRQFQCFSINDHVMPSHNLIDKSSYFDKCISLQYILIQ